MGLHKICKHKERARDRCKHAWWGSFRGKRVSLAKWTNREIKSKAEADKALDELTAAIRDGTFDERGLGPPPDNSPMTFGNHRRPGHWHAADTAHAADSAIP